MPPTKATTTGVATGSLFRKLGQRLIDAHKATAAAPVEYGSGGDLPAGINGGVARLTECCLKQIGEGKAGAGEYMFFAVGVCEKPVEFEGQRTQGGRTTIMEVLYDTPDRQDRKTVQDHYNWMSNELKKLGVDMKQVDPSRIEELLAALKKAAPYFKFRTFKFPKRKPTDPRYKPEYDGPDAPEPRVNHVWEGIIPDYQPDAGEGVDDGTADMAAPPALPAANGHVPAARSAPVPAPPAVTPAAAGRPKPGAKPAPPPPPEPEVSDQGDPFDPDALAAVYDAAGGEGPEADEASLQLTEWANAAGVSDDEIGNLPSFAAVVAEVHKRQGGAEAAEAGGTTSVSDPVKGDLGKYAPKGPGGKKGKPVEVEVKAVDKAAGTMDLQSIDDPKKSWKGVPFAELVQD